jgi:hypothetical protein
VNAATRKALLALRERIEVIQGQASDLTEELRPFGEAEQEKYDNLSEGLQASERGQQYESAASSLSEAADALEDIANACDTAVSAIDSACE